MTAHLISRGMLPVWYCIAWMIAVFLIATGQVHRARRRAFSEGVISAIYFHKPNRRLLVRCVVWLMKNGYTFVSAGDVIEMFRGRKPVPRGAVWLSFDDGWRQWIADVLPVIRRWKIPVTLFIPAGIVEGDGKFPWLHDAAYPSYAPVAAAEGASPGTVRETITLTELREIVQYPEVTLGSHTMSHALTPYCTDERIRAELGECKSKLELWTGKPVECFAYPEGMCDGRERAYLTEFGYELALTTRSEFITLAADRFMLPRFGIGDDTSFPQAICSMAGVWRPLIDPVRDLFWRAIDIVRRGAAECKRFRRHTPVRGLSNLRGEEATHTRG